jgi:hypothetical protein
VAAIEIGVIGYVSKRPILDTMGLVSPDMSRHQRGWAETLVYALTVHQPDYAVTLPGTAWDQVVDRWWFQRQYKPVAHFDGASVYQRVPAPPAYKTLLNIAFVSGLTLTRVSFSEQNLQPGSDLEISLHVDVQAAPAGDYLFTVYLADAQTFARFALTTVAPFDGRYRSQHWQAGDKLAIPVRLTVPADLASGVYRLGILIYDPERDGGLPLRDVPDGLPPDIQVGWLRLGLPPLPAEAPGLVEQPLSLQWQEGIELTAMKLPERPLAPGDALPLYFTWQAWQTISRDLTFFIHLVDAGGNIVAQQDRRPLGGRWPTAAWRPGDVLYDGYQLELPDNLMPGHYGLRLGFYDAAGRLPLAENNNDNWFLPEAITVVQQP